MPRSFPVNTLSKEVAKKSVDEAEYTIPSGKRLRIDRFLGGHEYTKKEARIELVLRDGSDSILFAGYGNSFQFDVGREYVGDGDKKIVLRLVNQDSDALHMTGIWEGVIEDG